MLEVNPRASRTVPFASKATGVNLVDAACRLAAGATLAELDLPPEGSACAGHHVKAAVLPFVRFAGRRPGARPGDALDGRGDGERRRSSRPPSRRPSAPRGARCPAAGARSSASATPTRSPSSASPGRSPRSASSSSRRPGRLPRSSSPRSPVERVEKGEAVVELVRSRGVELVVNTPQGRNARRDGYAIREAAVIARRPLHHDARGRPGRGRGDRERPAEEPALAPGAPGRAAAAREALACRVVSGSPCSRVERDRRLHARPARARLARARRARAVLHARGARPRCCRGRSRSASPRPASSASSSIRSGPARRRSRRSSPGETIAVFGPLGHGFRLDVARPLLVGGGIGIAPFPYLAEALEQPPAILGFRSARPRRGGRRSSRTPRS